MFKVIKMNKKINKSNKIEKVIVKKIPGYYIDQEIIEAYNNEPEFY